MNDQNISDDLLVKYLLGETTEVEHSKVAQWIGSSAANKDQFDSFRLIWEQSRQLTRTNDLDTDAAWQRFQQRTSQPKTAPAKTIVVPNRYQWLKAAAAIMLLVGCTWAAWNYTHDSTTLASGTNNQLPQQPVLSGPASVKAPDATASAGSVASNTVQPVVASEKENIAGVSKGHSGVNRQIAFHPKLNKSYKNEYTKESLTRINPNEYICNNTPYPFEICITQTVKCNNDKASAISTCSIIEPDQSGRLHYKSIDKIAKNCKATIDEIRITKINTGETIVLNDHSSPSTAQNFFNHLTGKKKGDVFAGMFHSDCDEDTDDCGLTFDSNFGNLIMQ
jgi:hypothetical protein